MSNRSLIANALVKELQKIDGRTSPYDYSYSFKTDLNSNVFRNYKTIDELNDFPSLVILSGLERRKYQTKGLTEAVVLVKIFVYVYSDEPQSQLSDIIDDVEHVIYNMKLDVDLLIQDITVEEIETDLGLLQPYGMAEIFLSVRFEIFNN